MFPTDSGYDLQCKFSLRKNLQESKSLYQFSKWLFISHQVKLSVIMAYASSLGILCSLLLLFFGLGAESSIIASRIWLAKWSSTNVTTSQQRDTFLGVYGTLGFGQVLLTTGMSLMLAYSAMKAARNLHEGLLVNIMHLPMQFFETTPIGRIVNRFSRDVNSVDDKIPRSLGMFIRTFLSTVGTIFVISYSTPLFLTCVLPLGGLYIFIQVSSKASCSKATLECHCTLNIWNTYIAFNM